jgi:hypothetical protein
VALRNDAIGAAYSQNEMRVIAAYNSKPLWQAAFMPEGELLRRVRQLSGVDGDANVARVAKWRGCRRLEQKGLLVRGKDGIALRSGDIAAQKRNAEFRFLVEGYVRRARQELSVVPGVHAPNKAKWLREPEWRAMFEKPKWVREADSVLVEEGTLSRPLDKYGGDEDVDGRGQSISRGERGAQCDCSCDCCQVPGHTNVELGLSIAAVARPEGKVADSLAGPGHAREPWQDANLKASGRATRRPPGAHSEGS